MFTGIPLRTIARVLAPELISTRTMAHLCEALGGDVDDLFEFVTLDGPEPDE